MSDVVHCRAGRGGRGRTLHLGVLRRRVFSSLPACAIAAGLFAVPIAVLPATPALAQDPSPPFTECPAVGYDTSCETLIDITGSGVTVLNDPTQGPFEGSDDTLVGVLNESSAEITASGCRRPTAFLTLTPTVFARARTG